MYCSLNGEMSAVQFIALHGDIAGEMLYCTLPQVVKCVLCPAVAGEICSMPLMWISVLCHR